MSQPEVPNQPDGEPFEPPRHFALVAAVFEGALVVLAVALGWVFEQDPLATFPDTVAGVASGLGWGLAATGPPLALLVVLLRCPWRPIVDLVRLVDELLVPLFQRCWVVEMAVIATLAGLGEEMLFRGIVQPAVAGWIPGSGGVWIGLAAAAVLFGLLHRVTTTYAVLATAIGFYLGAIWLLTDNLLVPITAHAAYDFVVMVYLVLYRKPASQRSAARNDP